MNHTIAAIATAPGEAGISIIRISGPDALTIAGRVFISSGPPPSQRPDRAIIHGVIRGRDAIEDEVILLIMRAPRSYTREDVVEIQAHGGTVPARRVLRCVLKNGARPAEPGEFTKRAFLNGRIDLLQAEAVLDLIRARSDRAARSALEQLEGHLSEAVERVYNEIIAAVSDIEASLDFSEEESAPDIVPGTLAVLENAEKEINRLLETWEEGHLLREGALVVISGKPNVGKSTLLNILLGRDRAIVSDTPGTTRDTIEEMMTLNGIPLRLVDTAGIRKPESEVEKHGVERAIRHADAADIRIHVLDGSVSIDDEDRACFDKMDPHKTIVVLNKSDLGSITHHHDCKPFATVSASCLTGDKIDVLKSLLSEKTGLSGNAPSRATISERHRDLLNRSLIDLREALGILKANEDMSLVSKCLRYSSEKIGSILGKTYDEDILDAIFSRFCIGK